MDKSKTIKKETETLLKKMIDTFEVDVEQEEDTYHVVIKTDEEASTVIGRHGETIRAIQKILEVITYKQLGEGIHILINVNDYREKQKDKLNALAEQTAQDVKSSGQSTSLRGLSSYERKMIHEYITEKYPDLTTHSVGEGRERQLVVEAKGDVEGETEA